MLRGGCWVELEWKKMIQLLTLHLFWQASTLKACRWATHLALWLTSSVLVSKVMALFPEAAQITPEFRSSLSSSPRPDRMTVHCCCFLMLKVGFTRTLNSLSLFFFLARNPVSIVNPCTARGRGSRGTAQSCAKVTCPVSVEDPYWDAQISHHK